MISLLLVLLAIGLSAFFSFYVTHTLSKAVKGAERDD